MNSPTTAAEELIPVYVWEAPVRITHWLIVLSIAVLSVTGFYIGNPFLVASGPAGEHFIMGWMKAVHFYFAIVFTLSVLARIWWMFVGNRWARWDQFIPVSRQRRRGMPAMLRFYLLVTAEPPREVGHNALAGASYSVIFLIYLVMIATGNALYAVDAHVDSPLRLFRFLLPLFGGAQTARWIHHAGMWLLLIFTVHHVASAILVGRVERNGIVGSILSGFKFLRPSDLETK